MQSYWKTCCNAEAHSPKCFSFAWINKKAPIKNWASCLKPSARFVFSAISRVFRIQIWSYKPYVRFPWDFCDLSHINPKLQTLCSFSVRFMLYFAYESEVTNPMFIFNAVSVALRIQICSCFVRFLLYFAYKSEVTNPLFVFSTISGAFRIQIRGYNPRLQTECSCSVKFLQSFAHKSEVTNPMFVFSALSNVFRVQIWGYKPYVHFQ